MLCEFSSLARVREDATDTVLNVKQIALRMAGEGPRPLPLNFRLPRVQDISPDGRLTIRFLKLIS